MKITNSQISFNGHYQGLIKKYDIAHKCPIESVYACPYADRMMIKIFSKVMKTKDKKQMSVNITNTLNGNIFEIAANKNVIKKHIPLKLRVLKSLNKNLEGDIFWKIFNAKKVTAINYTITDLEIKNLRDYFNKPKNYSSVFPEDAKIDKKINNFLNAIIDFKTV